MSANGSSSLSDHVDDSSWNLTTIDEKLQKELNTSTESSDMDKLTSEALSEEVNEMKQKLKDMSSNSCSEEEEEDEEDSSVDEGIEVNNPTSSKFSRQEVVKREEVAVSKIGATDDSTAKKFSEGHLAWARIKGYSYWPAIVTVDPLEGLTVKNSDSHARKPSLKVHFHFISYENQRAWVPLSSIMEFKGFKAYRKLAEGLKATKRKDFFPSKRYEANFETAVKLAEEVEPLPYRERLEKLGYVYILVEAKPDTRTAAEKKLIPKQKKLKVTTMSPPTAKNLDISTSTNDTMEYENDNKGKKRRKINKNKVEKKIKKTMIKRFNNLVSVVNVSSLEPEDEIKDIHGDDEMYSEPEDDSNDELKLGSLVWGKMSTFPFWPCFITNGKNGDFMRKCGKTTSYHVQFFNWNDESGWVSRTLPWCTLEEFKQRALSMSKQEWKSWYPQAKTMVQKWEEAYQEAHATIGISRRRRYEEHLALYRMKQEAAERNAILNPPRRKRAPKQSDGQSEDKSNLSGNSKRPNMRRSTKKSDPLKFDHDELPPGWSIEFDEGKGKHTYYQSPDGSSFENIRKVVSHLFQQNIGFQNRKRSYSCSTDGRLGNESGKGWFIKKSDELRYEREALQSKSAGTLLGAVTLFKDESLPLKWRLRKTQDRTDGHCKISYISPDKTVYDSKFEVANFLERMGHPALELEHFLTVCVQKSKGRKGSKKVVKKMAYSINLSKSTAEEFLSHPILGKTVIPCFVEVVKLPDIFLAHPSVSVKEEANEMVICDLYSGEFIAKKIIYD